MGMAGILYVIMGKLGIGARAGGSRSPGSTSARVADADAAAAQAELASGLSVEPTGTTILVHVQSKPASKPLALAA